MIYEFLLWFYHKSLAYHISFKSCCFDFLFLSRMGSKSMKLAYVETVYLLLLGAACILFLGRMFLYSLLLAVLTFKCFFCRALMTVVAWRIMAAPTVELRGQGADNQYLPQGLFLGPVWTRNTPWMILPLLFSHHCARNFMILTCAVVIITFKLAAAPILGAWHVSWLGWRHGFLVVYFSAWIRCTCFS